MRLMFDSVNPYAIPADAAMVAGYEDGVYAWSAAGWARFANAVKVRIAVGANLQRAQVIDVERGDYMPWDAPDAVLVQRSRGIDPTCYVNLSNWAPTQTEFQLRGIAEPHWWLAHYDGVAEVPAGTVAKQYIDPPGSGGHFDLSAVADFWPGVDSTYGPGGGTLPDMSFDDPDRQTLNQADSILTGSRIGAKAVDQALVDLAKAVADVEAKIANLPTGGSSGLPAPDEQLLQQISSKLDRILTELHTP